MCPNVTKKYQLLMNYYKGYVIGLDYFVGAALFATVCSNAQVSGNAANCLASQTASASCPLTGTTQLVTELAHCLRLGVIA